jgi:hypothetical protein
VAHYVFVASAGAYKANKMEPVLVEGDPRKESAGHVVVEKYLEEQVRMDAFWVLPHHMPFLPCIAWTHAWHCCCLHRDCDVKCQSARLLAWQGLPYTVFQPLYIYGPYSAKDYMRFFLDRLMRNRPVPIPAPGIQLTSLSHVEDLATLLAKVQTHYPSSWPSTYWPWVHLENAGDVLTI